MRLALKRSLWLLLLITVLVTFGYTADEFTNTRKDVRMCFGAFPKGPGPDSGAVATVETVTKYLNILWKDGVTEIRIYTCKPLKNSKETIASIAKKIGFKVAAGCWIDGNLENNKKELGWLKDVIKKDQTNLIIVSSEAIYWKGIKADKLIEYIKEIKAVAGKIPVSIDDTPDALLANPELVAELDKYVMVNPYAFWARADAKDGFKKFLEIYNSLKTKYPDKIFIVGEVGWPTAGSPKGDAVPNLPNALKHLKAINEWRIKNNVIVYWFVAVDEDWKEKNEGDFASHWGLWDHDGVMKPGVKEILFKWTIVKPKVTKPEVAKPKVTTPEVTKPEVVKPKE